MKINCLISLNTVKVENRIKKIKKIFFVHSGILQILLYPFGDLVKKNVARIFLFFLRE